MTIKPILDEHQREIDRHDKALTRIGAAVDATQKDVHEIRVMIRERDGIMNFLKTVFIALCGIGLLQVGSTIWFASSLNTTVTANQSIISDHEARVRIIERLEAKVHPQP